MDEIDLSDHFSEVYARLKALAHRQLYQERSDHTLHTTDLVHEAYLKLAQQNQAFLNQDQFFALAAQAMRRILISYAREKNSQKRGGDLLRITFSNLQLSLESSPEEILHLNEALDRFAQISARPAKVIEYWFFGGFKQEEIARIMNVSLPTIRRDWRLARAWLSRELKQEF